MALGLLFAGTAGADLPYGWSTVGWGDGENIASHDSAGTINVGCDGSDFWGNNDRGGMAYKQFTGDFDVSCRLVSRTGWSDGWTRGGIMARNTLVNNSENVMIYWRNGNRIDYQRRTTVGGNTSRNDGPTDRTIPDKSWMRLTRVGNTFRAYRSDDGVIWTEAAGVQTISMNATIYVGLAVSSHNGNNLSTHSFDNLKGFGPIDNADGATGVAITNATLNGNLAETNGATHVWAYWGEYDGGALKTEQSNALEYAFYDFDDTTSATLSGIDDGSANGLNGGLFAMGASATNLWPTQVRDKMIWTGEVH